MKIYLVGGAVRDELLGLPVNERDWVVVGATVEDMLKLGFRQVGKEFPVFLHPKTNEEYALARMERKVRPGYQGFTFDTSPTVSLKDDLLRRDLTINAMATSTEGELIDPYHGQKDLHDKVLRHVSTAFAEDPVRILRVGRFLARYFYLGFHIAKDTIQLMTNMVKAGEVDALVPERVWKELERALAEKNPEQFFNALQTCGAFRTLFPELINHPESMNALITASALTNDPVIRFACLLSQCSRDEVNALTNRLRAPNDYRDLAKLTALHHKTALRVTELSADELIELFGALDIYRRPERFQLFINACKGITQTTFNAEQLINCAEIARKYNVQQLIAQGFTGNDLASKLKQERTNAVAAWLKNNK
jgi:tRNA nucleotidyltransferase (CCA-adding enzyme)